MLAAARDGREETTLPDLLTRRFAAEVNPEIF